MKKILWIIVFLILLIPTYIKIIWYNIYNKLKNINNER